MIGWDRSIGTERLHAKHREFYILTEILSGCIVSTDMKIPYCKFSLIQSGGDT